MWVIAAPEVNRAQDISPAPRGADPILAVGPGQAAESLLIISG
jgi:hypothetical protein